MSKKQKISGVDDKCRICLCDDGCMSDIFSEDIKPKISHLGDSTSIHINGDDDFSPRNICHVCLYKLDMWIEFKEQFLRSNAMLREHLGLCRLSDDATTAVKRKHVDTEESLDARSVEHLVVKKIKTDETTEAIASNSDATENTCNKSEPMTMTSIDNIKNVEEAPGPPEKLVPSENQTISRRLASPTIQSATTTLCKRAKTTDRREASTKRWAARKRALLAATGENETDTDSETSDESRLSPVRKPRGKSIAREKLPDTRRISKSSESENDEKRTKENFDAAEETSKNDKKSCPSDKETSEKKIMITDESSVIDVLPRSLRSELIVDDATYVVTSTLVLTETPRTDEPSTTTDETTRLSPHGNPDERNQERNTDIIDAVQLRRVPPKSSAQPSQSEKKFIERCLNIEIEGTELEALRRVQSSLARYVETKLMKNLREDDGSSMKIENHERISLDRRVNEIVERSIKKNVEASRSDGVSAPTAGIRGNKTFTSEFVRAAMRSRIFQPRVMLSRCPENLHRRNSDNRRDVETRLGKRRSVKPVKYADYEGGSSLNSAGEEDFRESTCKFDLRTDKTSKVKTYGPAMAKQPLSDHKDRENQPEVMKNRVKRSILTPTMSREMSVARTAAAIIVNDENARANIEKHICGVCGDSFATRKQVEMHFSTHKSSAAIVRRGREKMMRCKRCHVIVEARYVKSHVCELASSRYECYSCGAKFHSDEMLVQHLETHASAEKPKIIEPAERSRATVTTMTLTKKQHNIIGGQSVGSQISDTSYTCFVCDKIFRDEQILKDHLQKHCDDMSEDEGNNPGENEEEPSDDKEQYQCAICGETLESEDALESHVEKHLFDEDEGENPNLISIVDAERTTKNNDNDGTMIHGCGECPEKFHSEMLLMLHQQAHEEEAAIAEWERRGIDNSIVEQHMCVICDQLFANEAELSEHLDIHNGNAHVCLLCDKPFITLEELQAHVDTH